MSGNAPEWNKYKQKLRVLTLELVEGSSLWAKQKKLAEFAGVSYATIFQALAEWDGINGYKNALPSKDIHDSIIAYFRRLCCFP